MNKQTSRAYKAQTRALAAASVNITFLQWYKMEENQHNNVINNRRIFTFSERFG